MCAKVKQSYYVWGGLKDDLREAIKFAETAVTNSHALESDVSVEVLVKRVSTLWLCLYTRQSQHWGDDEIAPS